MDRLLSKGYEARHIILEPTFKVGHNQQVYGDILVLNQNFENLILIENKTYGKEFDKEWQNMLKDGGQLFSYYAVNKTPFLCLLAYDFDTASSKIIYKSHIITTKDNKDHLQLVNDGVEKDKQKLGFEDSANANAKDYFKVWSETYQFATTTKGLLEDDILPYLVGKEKYTLKDLEVVPYSEITNIYHAFATILRNNAIGNYENTFYVLVDLFLCKIIDEQTNPHDLQFYYKGVSYDNPFGYIDRLLNLYEKGIDTLFKKKVVNISKSQIDSLFTQAKRYKGEFKAKIESIFDRQKYFNIKKFNFIEVENEEEFFINFKVLIQISNLIQDFYITQSENNQFLGDLFEGFLNRSVHQTEGRFFTPTPITNFIISSLPTLSTQPKVLDFACGAGHFLTEFITHHKNAKLYGIEKNKDLSKVAKTACVLHNASQAQVIFQDALDFIKETFARDFENGSFDLIISNPPYSVKGFLSTLTQKALANFTLSQSIDTKSYDKNGSIECFFIERAKQFLKENGLLVLVLPVSVLQKGQIYEKTREILLTHFKLLALVELNSRTFGSTGTQTIIAFAKRVEKYAKDLICALQEAKFDDTAIQKDFDKKDFLREYCAFLGYEYDEFRAFMGGGDLAQNLAQSEVFKDYKSDFDSHKPKVFKKVAIKESDKKALFEKSSFFMPNVNSKQSKQNFNDFEKSAEFRELQKDFIIKQFLEQVRHLEQEKMLYYAFTCDEKVLILKSPNEKTAQNKSNKANIVKFLGYDWSKRKGDEGIKYQTTTLESSEQNDDELKESKDDSDEEKKSKEALRNINSVKFISTPLYNPNDTEDKSKLAFGIKSFIRAQEGDLSKQNELNALIQNLQSNETDSYSLFISDTKSMLDFSRAEFSKAIRLNPATSSLRASGVSAAIHSNPFENSRFELVKLGEVCNVLIGGTPSRSNSAYFTGNNLWVSIAEMKGQVIDDTKEKITDLAIKESNAKLIPKGTTLLSFKLSIGKTAIAGKDLYTNEAIASLIPKNKRDLLDKYLFYLFNSGILDLQNMRNNNAFGKSLNSKILNNEVKIPKPPIEIQKQIIAECENIESQSKNTKDLIALYKDLIQAILAKCGISDLSAPLPSLREVGTTSWQSMTPDIIIATLLDLITTLESKLEALFCHTERSEVSQQNPESRDISVSAKPQYDKENIDCHDLTASNLAMTEDSPSFASGKATDSPSITEGVRGWVESLTTLLKSLPTPPKNGWERVKLGDYITSSGGNGFPKEYQGNKDSSQTPFIKVSDMNLKENEREIIVSNNYVTQEVINKLSLKIFPKNTIVFPKVGMAIHTNKKRILNIPCIVDNNVMGVNILQNKIDSLNYKFLLIVFDFCIDLKDIASNANPPSINNTNLNLLKIPLPPLHEQEKIISCIQSVESKITALDSTLPTLESKKSQILQKYLFD